MTIARHPTRRRAALALIAAGVLLSGAAIGQPVAQPPLLAKTVRLDKGVVVDRVTRTADGFSLSAVDARHRSQGRITLTFAKDPIRLQEWTLTDSQGQVTRVRLTEQQPAGALDPSLFVLHGAAPPPVPDETDSPR